MFAVQRTSIAAEHCRVAAVLRPSADSEIGMEVWLPMKGWNGKFQMVGNGGWGGQLSYGVMRVALNAGYATASTDTGHQEDGGQFALGHPEKLVDFAHRAVHETTVAAKAVIAAFYRSAAKYSYFEGCSTGGRQGLMAAQRYPEDFDGIIAGAPAINLTRLSAWRLAVEANILRGAASVVPAAKLRLVTRAALDACDGLDGVMDDFMSDPRRCQFDPSTLLCRGAESADCLTASQLAAVRSGYAPAISNTGDVIFPGLLPGYEFQWMMLMGQNKEPGGSINVDLFKYAVYQDPNWDWRTFDLERDVAVADRAIGFINANEPDLSAFKARGSKLILYHGWNDGGNAGAISPLNSVEYYSSVLKQMGPDQSAWLRLFMMPGVAHCGLGPGPEQVDFLAALERWRESGVAPASVLTTRVQPPPSTRVYMTRPLCPYPQVAVYSGVGSTRDAGNFSCRVQ
jgi:feruloyl esterase